ncbi:two-component system, CitB family, response regulator [Brevibacterium sandarakinum]|uniref:Transcriptional regulatory protein n=1 Tax=Brevibacterium sandarakinum TaxID=629680 RepID=A0A1H1WIR3_BRESA|nr:response regulator [Brevibacterium sandarakinum]SDS96560.1 two-component system, CitB family, response regulator [Brevibacterium sandarakinum]
MVNVLVLDDDFYVGQIHCRYVNEVAGFHALEPVRDLRAARRVLAEEDVDLLLADYVLPEGNGVELIRETDVDAVVLSAVAEAEVVRSALRAGAMTYILKPFAAEELQDFLRRYARFRRYWERDKVSQPELERQLRSLHDVAAPGSAPSQASVSSTSGRILEALEHTDSAMTAMQVSEAVGTSRATAQRHLAKLAESRAVTVSLQYGSTGRPEHLYGMG